MSRLRELVQDVRTILQRMGPSSKHIAYFQLLEAFKQPGCPVCTRLEHGAIRSLDALMYEQVNDPFTRERLVASHGFCNWHAWMLPSVPNSASGVALIYRHLLQETLDRLETSRRDAHPRGRWRRVWERLASSRRELLAMLAWRQRKTRCPICTFARQAERDDLKTILEFIAEPEFGGAFARSAGLCLPHLYAAMAVGRDHPNLTLLLAIQEARWKDLVWELEEFARKFDYRYADEIKGRETSSWHRVLEVFVGRAGLFGAERGDWPTEAPQVVPEMPSVPKPEFRAEARERPDELDTLRFENEKLERRLVEVSREWAEESARRAALQFQVHKLTEDVKVLELNLAGARGGAKSGELQAQHLREQIQSMQAEIERLRAAKGEPLPGPDSDR
jgi:hypothetical protein